MPEDQHEYIEDPQRTECQKSERNAPVVSQLREALLAEVRVDDIGGLFVEEEKYVIKEEKLEGDRRSPSVVGEVLFLVDVFQALLSALVDFEEVLWVLLFVLNHRPSEDDSQHENDEEVEVNEDHENHLVSLVFRVCPIDVVNHGLLSLFVHDVLIGVSLSLADEGLESMKVEHSIDGVGLVQPDP